jgi:hypothetical protein
MRNLVAAALSLSLIASSSLAAEVGPLGAGKPAGVKQAQMGADSTALLVIAGIVIVGVIIGVSTASDGNPPNMVSSSTVSTSAP